MSPALTFGWYIWIRHRRGLTILGGCWLAVIVLGRSLPVASFDIPVVGTLLGILLMASCLAFTWLLGIFSFNVDARLEARKSGFPARLWHLPLRTTALVGWPMLWGTAVLALVSLSLAWGLKPLFQLGWGLGSLARLAGPDACRRAGLHAGPHLVAVSAALDTYYLANADVEQHPISPLAYRCIPRSPGGLARRARGLAAGRLWDSGRRRRPGAPRRGGAMGLAGLAALETNGDAHAPAVRLRSAGASVVRVAAKWTCLPRAGIRLHALAAAGASAHRAIA